MDANLADFGPKRGGKAPRAARGRSDFGGKAGKVPRLKTRRPPAPVIDPLEAALCEPSPEDRARFARWDALPPLSDAAALTMLEHPERPWTWDERELLWRWACADPERRHAHEQWILRRMELQQKG